MGRKRNKWRSALLFAVVAAAGGTLLAGPGGQPQASAETVLSRSPVTVSLTFDDGTSDHLEAAEILADHDLTGTFYVNSSRLDAAGRLTTGQVRDLQTAGNEIGGHTVTHADLPTLSPDEQKRQICNDRKALLGAGFRVSNFAYPYGDDSPEVQQAVAQCGYNSARIVGDVVSPGSCHGCAYAESLPPSNRYAVKTPDSIKPGTSLEDMQNYVLQAEQNGGGWVVLVMHRICDGCDPYAVAPSRLDAFLTWLKARNAGGTVVKNVADVIGGAVQPAVDGPPPPPRGDGVERLQNGSMDVDTNHDAIPDCWQRGGYGENVFAWSNASSPHSGSTAMQVAISNFTSGDRRILTAQDLGACAPAVTAGHTYKVSGWYRASGTNRLVAYYRDSLNHWIYFSQGPALANASSWTQTTWTTPALPDGATALSVGISLRSVGSAAGDDFSVTDSDQTAPAVQLTSPNDGSRVRGTAVFTATATDASGIDRVDFLVDGVKACTATAAPYKCDYDTTAKPDSVIAVTARAVDSAGNPASSAGRNYTVSNSIPLDTTPPSVALTAPAAGASLSQVATLTADASDNDAVSRVLFYADDVLLGAAQTAPYSFAWDTTTHAEGAARLEAKALDLSGNQAGSAERTVTIDNYRLDTTPPVTKATCGAAACGTDFYNAPVPVALTATDNSSGVERIVFTTDGSEPTKTNGTKYAQPVTISSTTTVKYRAYDKAGNAEAVTALPIKIDTVAPTAAVSAPADGATITGVTYIKADVADANGIARVYFYLDGKALGSRIVTPYQWKWDPAGVAAGNHTLYVVAIDNAKNQTKSDTITVKIP
jgi:peptidoglycan/xylan/chitin deacetylase (PgdA/CDA1 family)